MSKDRHADRTVVVTGAASGIGRGIARRFGDEGANVVVADIQREPKQGARYDSDVTTPTDVVITEETSGEATYVETDVSDADSVAAMVEKAVETYSGIDVLVNNAGIQIAGDSQSTSVQEWQRSIDIDLSGAFYCAKFAVPHLVERQGQIINIGSVRGFEGGGGPPYAAAKGGVVNMTRDLAIELGEDGVRVNCINPGYIETPLQDINTDEDVAKAEEHTLLPRFGKPSDIGDAAVFLASDEAAFITGANLAVDGGWLAHSGL
ncbi:SDR family NAD(P)-dependent oxidoreductase [Halorubrum rutilum]|uniref:SDR family NAD(P)-dependent oxidoreductase n=1 Tax=Halorubrum rutilum TaxID=1364933 RepID=A0ABD6AHV2_9EURY|nr:SDR family oxidoreductase [Halorubrum rutilum]